MNFEILKTDRLLLRKMTEDTYRFVYDNYSTNQLLPFLGFSSLADLAAEKAKFNKGIVTFNRSILIFHLLDPKNEMVIGWCGYHTWYLDHYRAEIGYVLTNASYKRKGLMKEALARIIPYGFSEMNLNRIEAFVAADNPASIRLLEGSGFVREGVLREHYRINNINEDSIIYSLLKKEYQAPIRPR